MKIICMIPARAGSTRVKKKCLRYLGDKPLIRHVIDTCRKVKLFDEIYLNSPDEIFREIAENSNIKFYKRRKWRKNAPETNDDFMEDFLANIDCDIVIQMNPTSPFIKEETLEDFTNFMINDDIDVCISVNEIQIEALYKNKPINYRVKEKMSRSQDLEPIVTYSSGVFGFKRETFLEAMKKYGYALNCPIGLVKHYKIDRIESFDIDYEEDFQMAEALYESLKFKKKSRYYNPVEVDEVEVPSIMRHDGIDEFHEITSDSNNIDRIVNRHLRDKSWSERIINTENNSATLIQQLPGEGNRWHYHPDWNEWWLIIDGKWLLVYGQDKKEKVLSKNDIIVIPKNMWHNITVIGGKSAIRLSVARHDTVHTYEKGIDDI